MSQSTLYLRLAGAMQAWGSNDSKFEVRRTYGFPSKSGVLGILLTAQGIPRAESGQRLQQLRDLRMGVRVDRPGVRWWDYHTIRTNPSAKRGAPKTLLSRREYLCDASFLVALQGDEEMIREIFGKIQRPDWPPFLGRRSCPASEPIIFQEPAEMGNLEDALRSVPFTKRRGDDDVPISVNCIVDVEDASLFPVEETEVRFDVPISFEPPTHQARIVRHFTLPVGGEQGIAIADKAAVSEPRRIPRPRADYANPEYKKKRLKRLSADNELCVLCKSLATTVQHVTYARAGGTEDQNDLRSMCRLCHDAATMLEYGAGMTMERINPEDARWRSALLKKREEILAFRSLERRNRLLRKEEN